jgi:hypothetical protein
VTSRVLSSSVRKKGSVYSYSLFFLLNILLPKLKLNTI